MTRRVRHRAMGFQLAFTAHRAAPRRAGLASTRSSMPCVCIHRCVSLDGGLTLPATCYPTFAQNTHNMTMLASSVRQTETLAAHLRPPSLPKHSTDIR